MQPAQRDAKVAQVSHLGLWLYTDPTWRRHGSHTITMRHDATASAKITAEPTDAAAEPPAIGVLWPEREKRAIWQGLGRLLRKSL
eukprot:COSAG01_NODE_16416_length_1237_cov_11.505272_2_plen_85_part_00